MTISANIPTLIQSCFTPYITQRNCETLEEYKIALMVDSNGKEDDVAALLVNDHMNGNMMAISLLETLFPELKGFSLEDFELAAKLIFKSKIQSHAKN